jgi:endonuclease YncB( thermonuclease family)
MLRVWGILGVIGCLVLPAWAADMTAVADLADGGTATVKAVIDGDTVVLHDGRQVRLVGIQAPKLPLGRADFDAWPLSAEAKTHLESMVQGKAVELRLAAQAMDRHGRVLAHVVLPSQGSGDRVWVQGAMLAAGLARVYTFPDNRLLAAEMLALERQARADGSGLWGLPYYALRNEDNVRFDVGSFQIVEGRVLHVARIKDRVYLNFGANWRTDFTLKVMTRDEPAFVENGIDLMGLTDRRVRVRGWVISENGPMIELDHPQRLEVLNP